MHVQVDKAAGIDIARQANFQIDPPEPRHQAPTRSRAEAFGAEWAVQGSAPQFAQVFWGSRHANKKDTCLLAGFGTPAALVLLIARLALVLAIAVRAGLDVLIALVLTAFVCRRTALPRIILQQHDGIDFHALGLVDRAHHLAAKRVDIVGKTVEPLHATAQG